MGTNHFAFILALFVGRAGGRNFFSGQLGRKLKEKQALFFLAIILLGCTKEFPMPATFFKAHQGKIFSGENPVPAVGLRSAWLVIETNEIVSNTKSPSDGICRQSPTFEDMRNNANLNYTLPLLNTPEQLVCSGVYTQSNEQWFRTYQVQQDTLVITTGVGDYKTAPPLFTFRLPQVNSIDAACL